MKGDISYKLHLQLPVVKIEEVQLTLSGANEYHTEGSFLSGYRWISFLKSEWSLAQA